MALAVAAIVDRVVIASQRGAIDSIGHTTSTAISITSDSLGWHIHTRQSHLGRASSKASSSTSGASLIEAYRAAGLPSPSDVHGLSRQ